MTTIDQAMPASNAPPRTVTLPVTAFGDTWKGKPDTDVAIGLRLISSDVVENARAAARKQAREWHCDKETGRILDEDAYIDAYNDGFMRRCVARATCDVNDIAEPYFKFAENTVREALTVEGVRRLWDELLILHAENSVAIAPADDADIERMARVLLHGGALAALDEGDRVELRTLCSYVLAMLVGTGKADEVPADEQHEYRMTVA